MSDDDVRIIAKNRKAWFEYHILSKIETGIVLIGSEVKSIRDGGINLKDSYATLRNGEVILVGVHISHYPPASKYNHEPERDRKLLLNRKEINKLEWKVKEKGISLIPLSVYTKNGKIKIELATAKGKKLYDKREAIAKKDMDREQERELKYK